MSWIARVSTALVFRTLRLLFPPRAQEPGERSLDELRGEFGRRMTGLIVLWLLLAPAAGYRCYGELRRLGARVAAELPAGTYTSVPGGVVWGVVAAFLGLLASALGVELLSRVLLRERYQEFLRYEELAFGLSRAMELPLTLILSLGAALLVFAVADWYVVVTPDEVIRDNFLAVCEKRSPHADVIAIETAPHSQALLGSRPRRISVIHYGSGSSWTIINLPGQISDAGILEITRYISERSGVPVTEVESLRSDVLFD